MCGIAGIYNRSSTDPVEEATLRQMLAMIRHRGPDQFGILLDQMVGLGSARLSIIDLNTGQQPLANEDETLWIVFNGEIFNYVELRPELEARGHSFATNTDTEVLLHMYEEYGPACLQRLNGQFVCAIWDTRAQRLFLARDRLGVRPLFYTQAGGTLVFASEIKAILASRGVRAEIDPLALNQVFTFWSAQSPRSIFKGISELPPGHYLLAEQSSVEIRPFWQVTFAESTEKRDEAEYLEEFRSLLVDATQIRLRADVAVGAYLSGGLDSSTIAAIIRHYTGNRLRTFSITFSDPAFDEGEHQRRMAAFLGTEHQVVHVTHSDIGLIFPDVIWHTETPLLRTSPAPLFLLSKFVHEQGFKVVLTGEGADEFLGGYDIFKEALIRRFWARQPASKMRPALLRRLYPDITDLSEVNGTYLTAFFGKDLSDIDNPAYSHAIRWHTTSRSRRFFSDELLHELERENVDSVLRYPAEFGHWHPLQRAQYLEIMTFLSPYLLSSQGDRVAMAHSVEGRFPFLDYRLVEFCNHLPPRLKLRGLKDKYLLRQVSREWLPDEILQRPKRPFRAPIHRSFFGPGLDYVQELLSADRLRATGLFKATAAQQLVNKVERGMPLSETDDMALVGMLSTELLVEQFIVDFRRQAPLSNVDDVKVCRTRELAQGERYAV